MRLPIPWNVVAQQDVGKQEFSHSTYLRLSLVKRSRPRWQHAAVSCYSGFQAAVEIDENERDVVGKKASQLDSVSFHKERQRLGDSP